MVHPESRCARPLSVASLSFWEGKCCLPGPNVYSKIRFSLASPDVSIPIMMRKKDIHTYQPFWPLHAPVLLSETPAYVIPQYSLWWIQFIIIVISDCWFYCRCHLSRFNFRCPLSRFYFRCPLSTIKREKLNSTFSRPRVDDNLFAIIGGHSRRIAPPFNRLKVINWICCAVLSVIFWAWLSSTCLNIATQPRASLDLCVRGGNRQFHVPAWIMQINYATDMTHSSEWVKNSRLCKC